MALTWPLPAVFPPAATCWLTCDTTSMEQEVPRVSPGTINASRVLDLENLTGENRTLLSFDYRTTRHVLWGLLRFNYYGDRTTMPACSARVTHPTRTLSP